MSGATLPAFDIEGGVARALVRGLSVAALLSVFGALLFRTALAPPVLARMKPSDAAMFRRRWRLLLWSSWSVAIGTDYGLMALLKLVLFAVLFGLAARNRFRLTPALETASADDARRRLCRSVAVETGFGLMVVLAAGFLTSLEPAMHVQPIWPFTTRAASDDHMNMRM
jgi:hypothetical protein